MTTRFASFASAVVFAALPAAVSGQTRTGLPDASEVPFSWSEYVPSTTVGPFTVQHYLHVDGTPGGNVMPVFDRTSAQAPTQIGVLRCRNPWRPLVIRDIGDIRGEN